MKNAGKILGVVLVGLALAMTTGCGGKKMTQSGFLSDYSRLQSDDPLKKADWLYINKDADFSRYKKIMLDEVVFIIRDDAEYKGIGAGDMKELSDAFHKSLVEALRDSYEFTAEPGPEVMRLRIAITDVVPNKRVAGALSTIIPVGLALSIVKKGVTGSHIGVGKAAMEAELLDSQTGEVLGAGIDAETGKKYRIGKTMTKFGQIKLIFDDWANNFKGRLDKLSGRE